MKKHARTYLRRWTGLLMAVCVFVTMAVPTLADEPATPTDLQVFHGVYTGGETHNEHSAENSPLGDLVLPAEFNLIDGQYYYPALYLEFPDEEGGGNVSVQAGDITTESAEKVVIVYYDEGPDDYYEDHYGTYGVRVSMRDKSELLLNTGSINAAGQAVSTDNEDMSKMTMNIDGTITAGNGGISINNNNDSDATINSGTIISGTTYLENNSNGSAIEVFAEEDTDITINVTGDVHAGNTEAGTSGTGISTQVSHNSTATVYVSGSVTAEGARGVAITNGIWENDGHPNTTNISIGGSVTSDDMAFEVYNNYGTVNITVGGNEMIDDAGDLTSGGDHVAIIEADTGSKITFKAGDINGSNSSSAVRPEANGDRAVVVANIGNVTNKIGEGINGEAKGADSVVDIKAGDIDAKGIALTMDTKRDFYGNTDDGSIYGKSGTVTADVGEIDSEYNGIYAALDDGSITVNSGTVKAGYNGIDASTMGSNAESGITITVDGTVHGDECGISVDSNMQNVNPTYENSTRYIDVLVDDPHENWWEKTRWDPSLDYVWVSSGEGDNLQWTKYRTFDDDDEDYPEDERENLPYFNAWEAEWEYAKATVNPNNFVDISTGAVSAERTGIETSNNGGSFDINVNGGVSVSKVRSGNESSTITGVMAEATAGTTNITINGGMEVFGRDKTPTRGGTSSEPGEENNPMDEADDGAEPEARFLKRIFCIVTIYMILFTEMQDVKRNVRKYRD